MSLIRMSYLFEMGEFLKKTRHLYDIHCIYRAGLVAVFDESQLFGELKRRVIEGEAKSRFGKEYPFEANWSQAPIFNGLLHNKEVERAYTEDFGREFVFGQLPSMEAIILTFEEIKEKMMRLEEGSRR